MFKHFLDNNCISSDQSGFKPGDSCINLLVAITHVFKGFDDGLEVRGGVLYISKAFDKVLLKILISKLLHSGICNNLLQLLLSFLDSRKQQVLLNGNVNHGVSLMLEFHKV